MKVRKKVNAILLAFMMGIICILAPISTIQAAEKLDCLRGKFCKADSQSEISPYWNAIACSQCGQPAAWACLRHKSQLYDTVTHGDGCKKMYYRSPSTYYCTWCGWYYDVPLIGAYHYCYIIHTSCGKGSEIMCQCDIVYQPVYGK